MRQADRRSFLTFSALLGGAIATPVFGQQPDGKFVEPVSRIAKNDSVAGVQATPHALDPALELARNTLTHIRNTITDYTAIMVKRERIGNTLGESEYMGVKIRNRKVRNGAIATPLSVYMAFLKPAAVKGREVIYVENQNAGQIIAHEGGMRGKFLPTMHLDPNGMLAMQGQRYPITECGIENLVVKLIEKGERDRQHGECNVEFFQGAKIGDRQCTVLSVTHPHHRTHFDFHVAQVFIDDEMKIPIRYCAYTWPTSAGADKELLEEYTYLNVKLNVGLNDQDFSEKNPAYNF
ncbi:MAG: DUF1571 domain-containing protein [Planctomycetales bacterium]|nr:DUF1571 domain-containing protein [Planctomycetales bacterium]